MDNGAPQLGQNADGEGVSDPQEEQNSLPIGIDVGVTAGNGTRGIVGTAGEDRDDASFDRRDIATITAITMIATTVACQRSRGRCVGDGEFHRGCA